MTQTTSLPILADFDQLPDPARVPLPVVCGLFSISQAPK
ncbi:hypothetical protein EV672_101133 [Aquabacterium commune]|uniref:Uncharacterized protein n=1 Tax=Aquabacterium commune TaxID=70586 RepID=A0A4V3CWX4_9BURK|nr:hypothetical protein EV672_101133 [Aquabacterium commune]